MRLCCMLYVLRYVMHRAMFRQIGKILGMTASLSIEFLAPISIVCRVKRRIAG